MVIIIGPLNQNQFQRIGRTIQRWMTLSEPKTYQKDE